jgi:hypothetical protein
LISFRAFRCDAHEPSTSINQTAKRHCHGNNRLVNSGARRANPEHLAGILRETEQPDASWDWAYKLRLALNDDRYEAYGIEFEALLQGVILLETQWHRSWLPQRFPLVYVEYLASAPWNRRLLEDPSYLIGVGRALVLFARQRSVEVGYGGRVGLHALPGAEAFYRRYDMPDYGPDPDTDTDTDGLVCFKYATLTL